MTWYKTDPRFFEEFKQLIQVRYPSLFLSIEDSRVTLTGMLFLRDVDGYEIDNYRVKIVCLENYPKVEPIVYELGGRIPKIADRHFYPAETNACLFLSDERYKYYNESTTIGDFIQQIVEPFFLSQSHYELTGKWLFGDRRHGVYGIIDFYQEVLNSNDLSEIMRFLYALAGDKVKGHWNCFCGSKRKMRNCHFDLVKEFRNNIPKGVAQKSLRKVYEYAESLRGTNVRKVVN